MSSLAQLSLSAAFFLRLSLVIVGLGEGSLRRREGLAGTLRWV